MKEGMFLEMLVECLQKLLASDGILVERNKKFYNHDGKRIGEVDIVLSGKLGSANMMVGIECRDRKEPQDINWIRQIIGKKQDLADRGFRHWIAVSSSGFKTTARDLANKANIDLIVLGTAEPVEPEKGGPHTWMKWSINDSGWVPIKMIAQLADNDADNLEKIHREFSISQSWSTRLLVKKTQEDFISLREFIKPTADKIFNEIKKSYANKQFRETHKLKFQNLQGMVDGRTFSIYEIEVLVEFHHRIIHPEYRSMAFVLPHTEEILGIIGINKYQYQDSSLYVTVAFKPDKADNPIICFRDADGKPIVNKTIHFQLPEYASETPIRMIKFRAK